MEFLEDEDSDGEKQNALMPNSVSITTWENVTQQHTIAYLESIQGQISDVDVKTNFIDQQYLDGDGNLEIMFHFKVLYRDLTEQKDYDIYEGVRDAFATWSSLQNFVNTLHKANPSVFPENQNVKVIIPPRPTVFPSMAPTFSDSNDVILTQEEMIVIGGCVGSVVFILILAHCYIKNSKQALSRQLVSAEGQQEQANNMVFQPNPGVASGGQQVQVSTYIVTQPGCNEDISTLGYPTVTKPHSLTGNQVITQDEDISTLGDPTIFGAKALNMSHVLQRNESSDSNISSVSDSLIQGDRNNALGLIYGSSSTIVTNPTVATNSILKFNSRKGGNLFEFSAPAGSLGIMVDMKANCGPHKIHAIKEDSVLVDILKVGDKIVSFDDEDVGQLSATDLTQMIASRGNQPSRKFIILRP